MRQRGFTLVELMIVVAIIAVLAAIAIPNLLSFQAKAKQSEAKQGLKALFVAKKTHAAEHGTFACGTAEFVPEVGNRYTYRAGGGSLIQTQEPSLMTVDELNVDSATETASTFVATAMGNVDRDAFNDAWRVDQNNLLCNGPAATPTSCSSSGDDLRN